MSENPIKSLFLLVIAILVINFFDSLIALLLIHQTGILEAALTFTVVSRFKPHDGVRRGIVTITFDGSGPTWAIVPADFKLTGIFTVFIQPHVDGFVLNYIRVSNVSGTIDARQEESAAAGGGLVAAGATDLDTKVVTAEYIGF